METLADSLHGAVRVRPAGAGRRLGRGGSGSPGHLAIGAHDQHPRYARTRSHPQTPAHLRGHRHRRRRDQWRVSRVAQFTALTQPCPPGIMLPRNPDSKLINLKPMEAVEALYSRDQQEISEEIVGSLSRAIFSESETKPAGWIQRILARVSYRALQWTTTSSKPDAKSGSTVSVFS